MLKGIDISHWQENDVLSGVIDFKNYDFILMKATEGLSFKDKYFRKYMDILPSSKLAGAYHFAHAECNDPIKEARFYLNEIRPYIGSILMALDLEDKSLANKKLDEWALKFCNYVYEETGIRPLIYCSQSTCKRLKRTAGAGFGLWVAEYSVEKPKSVKPFPFWAIWQYTNRPIDHDYFNGNREQFIKYCVKE